MKNMIVVCSIQLNGAGGYGEPVGLVFIRNELKDMERKRSPNES